MTFLTRALCAISLLTATVSATGGAVQALRPESDDLIAPNRYIVEFDTAAHLQAGLSKRDNDPHERFYRHLRERDVAFDVHEEYKSKGTFVGASVQVSSAGDIDKLATAEGVLNIYTVSRVDLPQPRVLDVSGIFTAPGNASSHSRRSVSTGTYGSYSQLPFIQADLVHRTKNIGSGIKIAIVDTGIDYNHPSFGSCFRTPGCKVQKGYDFVGDAFNGNNERVPDDDPFSSCSYHGSSVAGLAAGLDNPFDAPGVAPGATIFPYRVFGCTGSTYTDIELAAMLRAEADGADIINFSISSDPGWSGSALGVAAANLAKKGIQCVWASGNAGLNGMFYAGSDGTDAAVISVGSVDGVGDNLAKVTFTASDGSSFDSTTSRFFPFPSSLGPIKVYVTDNDICAGFPANAPSMRLDHVVVVPRAGRCTFAAQAETARQRGAAAIFFYNNEDGINFPSGVNFIPFGAISRDDGGRLRAGVSGGLTYTATFPQDTVYLARPSAGRLTDFSSTGPTYDMFYTTKLVAPGFNILAPYPDNRWTIASGTSFAAPITAGAVALYLQAQADRGQARDLQAMRDALFSTASTVPYAYGGKNESAAAVGSGLVQISNAINAGTKVTPSMLTLNDTEFFAGTKHIVVTNLGSGSINYKLSHQPASLLYGLDNTRDKMADYVNLEHDVSLGATVKFSRTAFTLGPGQSTILLMSFTAPAGADIARLPIYSGQISITGGPVPMHVTYMGAATKMRDTKTISTRRTPFDTASPALLQGVYASAATEGQVFGFTATSGTRDFPSIMFNLLTATRLLSVDLVAADANMGFSPTYTKRGFSAEAVVPADLPAPIDIQSVRRSALGQLRPRSKPFFAKRAATTQDKLNATLKMWCEYTKYQGRGCTPTADGTKTNTYAQVPTRGNILTWTTVSRNNNNIEASSSNTDAYTYIRLLSPRYNDGSRIPNGNYKFLLRILRVNGDPTQQADYDSWLSPSFVINA